MHKNTILSPKAEKITHVLTQFDDQRNDPYYWLKERESSKVIDYLKAENNYTEEILKPVQDLEQKIFNEMKARTKEDDSTVPLQRGEYFYSQRFTKGSQYPQFYRQKGSTQAPEELILDVNQLAQGHSFCNVPGTIMSPNQEIMAYAADFMGRRFYTLFFKNLKTGQLLAQKIENTSGNMAWAADNNTLFYTVQDPKTLRSDKIYRYDLKANKAELIFTEKDETFSVYLSQSLTKNYIYINSVSTLTTEVRFISAHHPHADFQIFKKRERKNEYSVTDGDDGFYILTNKNAPNNKIMKTDFHHLDESSWQELVAHDPKTLLTDLTVFKNYVAIEQRKEGLTHIQILEKKTHQLFNIPFADQSYLASVGANAQYNTDELRYEYESMRLPESIYDFNMSTHQQVLKKIKEVPEYNPDLYLAERTFITARDGTQVPVSLIRKKDTPLNNSAPMLIYGYGSYGANMDPWFSQNIFSLIDRGFVYAKAHIRGGSEMGRYWYDQGRTEHKKNTFYDFIDCTEGLIKLGYANKNHIYAMGGSAGGLLMGAITNMRPDLYRGIVAQVPFVDVLTTMLDDSIPLTTGEYDEWGNPNEKKYYDYIKSYSPYDNITAQAYPHMLITTGLHDSQVQYWEPAKWTARLRELKTNDSYILLKTDMEAGHGGASGRFDQLKETAREYAFILFIEKLH